MGGWLSGWWISSRVKKVGRGEENGPSTQLHSASIPNEPSSEAGSTVLGSPAQALRPQRVST